MDERRLKFFLALQKKVEESKNLSPKAREKFYGLAEQYIGKVNVVEEPESSENDLVRAYRENGFVSIETEDLEVSVKNKKRSKNTITIDLNKHRPIETCRFLQFLSSNANPMKFLIHDKPDGFFLEDIKKSWAVELEKVKHSNIKESLRYRFFYFSGLKNKAGENNGWWSENEKTTHKFSYSDSRVEEWCASNPNSHPILHFENEILIFKRSIKFFEGNLIERIISAAASSFGELFGSFEIEHHNFNNAEFYADADAFLSGLKNVFNSIKQRISNGNKIKITFESKSIPQGRFKIIKVVHLNSECDRELDKINLFGSDNGGDFKEAEKKFYQVCDWSIVAKHQNQGQKINILYDIGKTTSPKEKVAPKEIEGFTHIFTFFS